TDNYDEFAQACNDFHAVGTKQSDEELRAAYSELMNRRLCNFLSSMRLFLDHIESRLKRTSGKNSVAVQEFKRRSSDVYDTVFAYRFAYKLRNYSQHFGDPIWGVGFSSSVPDQSDEVSFSASTTFDTYGLLVTGGDCWGPLRKELEAMPRHVDVAGIMQEVPDALFSIWAAFLDVQYDRIQGIHLLVSEMLDVEGAVPGTVILGEWVDNDGSVALSYQQPPLDVLELVDGFLKARPPANPGFEQNAAR
ncbi:MAG: hypothetical protein Q8K89_06600, partial [Actinomycetota bacterium]|nr:hypothetical protein [Actinomycetota bacterium]